MVFTSVPPLCQKDGCISEGELLPTMQRDQYHVEIDNVVSLVRQSYIAVDTCVAQEVRLRGGPQSEAIREDDLNL